MAKNSVNFRPIERLSAIPDSASRTNSNNQHASGKFETEATRRRSNGDNGRQVSFTTAGLEKTDQKVVADLNSSTAHNYHHSRSTQSSPSSLAPLALLPSGKEQCESILNFSPTINNFYNPEPSLTCHLDQNNLSMNSPCLYTPVPTDHDPAEEYIIDRHEESPTFEFTESAPASDFTDRKRNNPHFDAVSETVDKSDISGPALKKVKIEKASGDKPKSDQPLTKSKVSTSSVVPSPDATDDEEETERRNDDDDNLTLKELKRKQQLFDQSGPAKAEILETTHEVSKPSKIDSLSEKMENGTRRSKAPLNKRDKELNELLESTVQFAPRYLTRRSRNAQPEAANKSNTERKNANKGEAVKYTEVSSLRRGRSSRGNGRNK
ncbi:hypothetical protein BKA69DRAFT_1122361 [Paraphysoderma sedebokerense]|nr:hypothetical protein BKA69DRAFT_1122361 [Paraphysoderma sedebokerense]